MAIESIRTSPLLVGGLLAAALLVAQDQEPVPPALTSDDAPAEVDQALRARVEEFFQYHVDGELFKAFDIVAEETKAEYFAAAKMTIKNFTVDHIEYTDDSFTDATVTLTVTRVWGFYGQETLVTLPMVTTWKIEEGEWRWYHKLNQEWITPMGDSTPASVKENILITQNPDGTVNLPADLGDPKTVAAAGAKILQRSNVDKSEVHLSLSQASEEHVVFHNGNPGAIQLDLSGIPGNVPGLSVSVDQTSLGAEGDATITFRYEPPEEDASARRPNDFNLRLLVIPFNQVFGVRTHFDE